MPVNLPSLVHQEEVADFCRRWGVATFAFFGSVLRPDFHESSDVDILVTFQPASRQGLLARLEMQRELEAMFGRSVDLVDRRAVEESPNYLRRREILSTARVVYGA